MTTRTTSRPADGRTGKLRASVASWDSAVARWESEPQLRAAFPVKEIAKLAPALADSIHGAEVDAGLSRIPVEVLAADARFAYARGRREVLRRSLEDARLWYTRAQAASPQDLRLIARLAFELGSLNIAANSPLAAEAVGDWAESCGADPLQAADLAHLRALLAERTGEHAEALGLYRLAIRRSRQALTPMTHVLALRNLAGALVHRSPHESRTLYQSALGIADGHALERGMRAALLNGLGYALIVAGEFGSARSTLAEAERAAHSHGRGLSHLFARFNEAVLDELEGDCEAALTRLADVRDAAQQSAPDLAQWCDLRAAWLNMKLDHRTVAAEIVNRHGSTIDEPYRDTVETLRAFLALVDGQLSVAEDMFRKLAETYERRGDELTAFALLLWLAVSRERGKKRQGARLATKKACEIGLDRGFSLSPNWWAQDVAEVAPRTCPPDHLGYAHSLRAVPHALPSGAPAVRISRDGSVTVGGHPLPDEAWRSRRAGARVLRRMFVLLVRARAAGIDRDSLADALWPESDGDRAIRNLRSAVKDLRRATGKVPGLFVVRRRNRYYVETGDNVAYGQ